MSAAGQSAADAACAVAAAAELRARTAVLERQLDTSRAQSEAARVTLEGEVSRLRCALAQEQGERARLLGGMREALAGLRTTGDTEGRLRSELLAAHQVCCGWVFIGGGGGVGGVLSNGV